MTIISDFSLLDQPVTAAELRKWPLMHGTLCTGEVLRDIRHNGLIPTTTSPNSFDYDRQLGRQAFVFMAPASFRLNYGYRCGAILIDPAILTRRTDLLFSDRDIGEAIECLKILIEHGKSAYCGAARDVEALDRLVTDQKAPTPRKDCRENLADVIRSQEFVNYYNHNYQLTETQLFGRIEDKAKSAKWSLAKYFGRTNLWTLQEEILAPTIVEPEFLLGHWDGAQWSEWAKSSSADTQIRVRAWLQACV